MKSEIFSFNKENLSINIKKMVQKKNNVVDILVKGVEYLVKNSGIDYYKGKGRLLNNKAIEITNEEEASKREIVTDAIVIATGSKPSQLPGVSPNGNEIITSDEAIDLTSIPKDIIIVGGGFIGIEFSSIFKNFGSNVTLVELLPNILPSEDIEISDQLRRILENSGIKILTETRTEKVKKIGGKVTVCVKNKKGEDEYLQTEKVLLSVGRSPHLEDLEIKNFGIELDRGFIKVDSKMQTNISGIYAIGDVIGNLMLAHSASQEGIVAVQNIIGGYTEVDYRKIPRCIYSIPEVASVGLTEQEAVAENIHFEVGRFPFSLNGKALAEDKSEGFVKIITDKKIGQIIGVHILGENASELIGGGAMMVSLEATLEDIEASVQAHPTLFEALKEAALDVKGKAIHVPPRF